MLSRLTQLDAVNEVLSALGEKPVATLEGQTSQMARLALNELNSTTRQVQSEGWNFNQLPQVTLSVEVASGEIRVPDNFIRFDVPDEPHVIPRGSRLYDRINHTYVFSRGVTGSALVLLEWDELPEEIRRYTTALAAKKTYDQFVGAAEGRRNLYDEVMQARARALDMDYEVASYNMMDDPTMPYFEGSHLVPGAPRDGYRPTKHLQ